MAHGRPGGAIGLFPAAGAALGGWYALARATALRCAALLATTTSACLACTVPASFVFGFVFAVFFVMIFGSLSTVSALGTWALLNGRAWGALPVTAAVGLPAWVCLADSQDTQSLHAGLQLLGWTLIALLAAMWATLVSGRLIRPRP